MDPRTVNDHRDELQILDVREPQEWAAVRIDGAVHIPLGQLPARLRELDRDRPVVTVCRAGGRASQAAQQLSAAGLTAQVLDGGITAWQRDGLPVTTPNGRPGAVA